MPLTREEIKTCREAFDTFDKDSSGSVDLMELKQCLFGLGASPTDDELHQMISQVDEDGSNEIHFAEFLKIIEAHKAHNTKDDDDTDTLEAFVALGGGADKSGGVHKDKLSNLTEDFGLEITAAELSVHPNEEGLLDFEQFKILMG
mmetsp:Transcript_4494/g.6069  ORF Transcript_4494/g.6069 Transcript_4494/m.6069 type:complete len:146 (+) Transcript_4494:285-722(+)|eukprot:CAMPEP_0196595572 /NCGR_PEP_ID=MMETSP1081-20130531/81360_1 /TAXON_ID=36882 /ORGANISM="Pyramimonas amylifera, Strain CCMP720" /LENGTH=145 /DNA_ID=CAMNT_0041920183 /DNA_START=284 /DNA_END=721 /DNA_ORIENTATION=+